MTISVRASIMPFGVLLGFGFSMIGSHQTFAGPLDGLDPALQEQVKRGDQVSDFQAPEGSPWPVAKIYQRIDTDPEEAAALFFDFELQPKYVPGCTQAKIETIADNKDSKVVQVAYAVSIPLLGNQYYTVKNTLSSYNAEGKSYRIDWSFVKASSLKNIIGHVTFEPFGTGTLMVYINHVIPGPSVPAWGFIIDKAKENIKIAAQAIVDQAKLEKLEQPKVLAGQVQKLRDALK